MTSAVRTRQTSSGAPKKTHKRLFGCTCGHKLRLGASRCGACYRPTPIYNRRWFYLLAAFGAVLGLLIVKL
ncbi:hypothetical protein [Martelella sp. HB161492]|uniref:hypothetical protein n=1 Tax=Martelella sp. HB161492 TaxID=2720726 RepID=UPI00158FF3AD|nr:hypothetical protein [Martelella sp. HB161492]